MAAPGPHLGNIGSSLVAFSSKLGPVWGAHTWALWVDSTGFVGPGSTKSGPILTEFWPMTSAYLTKVGATRHVAYTMILSATPGGETLVIPECWLTSAAQAPARLSTFP